MPASLYSHFISVIWGMQNTLPVFDLLRRNLHWWSSTISYVNLDSRMLDEILFIVYESDRPLKLLQSVLSFFLSTCSMTDSWNPQANGTSLVLRRITTNIVKDEKGDLATDLFTIVARRRKYFSQLLILHGVNDVGQTEIRTVHQKQKCLSRVHLGLRWLWET